MILRGQLRGRVGRRRILFSNCVRPPVTEGVRISGEGRRVSRGGNQSRFVVRGGADRATPRRPSVGSPRGWVPGWNTALGARVEGRCIRTGMRGRPADSEHPGRGRIQDCAIIYLTSNGGRSKLMALSAPAGSLKTE